ncbi:hypothetical protein J6590_103285 [Homalodisca vitripennis]|nr:hypothetical protein J6590_103285 [Homalodisca vitripennis]
MLEALKEAIDSYYEGTESSKECGPTPNTSYRDVNFQKEASAEDDFDMLNESNVTSRASSPCLLIMEDFEWIDRELGNNSLETSPKPNVNFITNYNTTIQDAYSIRTARLSEQMFESSHLNCAEK